MGSVQFENDTERLFHLCQFIHGEGSDSLQKPVFGDGTELVG